MKTNRLLRIVLPLALLLQLAFSACGTEAAVAPDQTLEPAESAAAETIAEEPKFENPRIVVESAEAQPGDEVILSIHVLESPGIAACRLVVEYDSENLSLVSASYGPAFAENGEEPAHLTSPFMLAWSQVENLKGDALLAELSFKVNDQAKVFRVFPVTVTYTPTDLINLDEAEVPFAIENGSITTVK